MTNQEYAFKYGEGQIRFALDSGLVAGELRIKEYPPIPNAVSAIREAIRKPIQSKPVRGNCQVGSNRRLSRERSHSSG